MLAIGFHFDYPRLAARAGRDPVGRAQQVWVGNPAEIAVLGAKFLSAAGHQQAAARLANKAAVYAAGSLAVDDQSPVDVGAETAVASAVTGSGGDQLTQLAAVLDGISTRLASADTACTEAIERLLQRVDVLRDRCQAHVHTLPPALAPADVESVVAPYLHEAVRQVRSCADEVTAQVAGYDDYLVTQLGKLHGLGYTLPVSADVGGHPPSAATVPGATTPPEQVAAWWAGLTPAQQTWLVQHEGHALAATHGLPAPVLDAVNRRQLAVDQAAVQQQIDLMITTHPGPDWSWTAVLALGVLVKRKQYIDTVVATLASPPATATDRKRPPVYLLEYDDAGADGDGVAVIALGNPDTAADVAVVVPGLGSSIETLGGQVANATALYDEMAEAGAGDAGAVIVYQGYDAPDGVEVLSDNSAEEGAVLLAEDLAGWNAAHAEATGGSDPHVTVIGHSYGSLVVSLAAQEGGSAVDDVVVVGSPGVAAYFAEQVVEPGHFWAAATPSDWVVGLTNPIGPFGPNPLIDDFGAQVFTTGSASGHHQYFAPGTESLANVAEIAVGDYDDVRTR